MRQHKKHSTVKALIILMISVLFISACGTSNNGNSAGSGNSADSGNSSNNSSSNSNSNEGQPFISPDGQVQLTLDKKWIEDPALKNQSILGVSERKNEKYAMVNMVSKSAMSDSATLEDFKNVFINNIKSSITNAEESNNKTITVDSTQAELFEITGEAQKVKVQYLVAVLEKGGSFYQIVTWSTQSKFESNKEELLKAIESFKVLKETPITTESASPSESTDTNNEDDKNTETTTMTSEDKKLEITIPAYMSYELELSPIADIQASRTLQEEYLMVLREGKDTFADNYTLTDYYDAINGSMSTTLTNSTQTEPKEIQVNGQPAIQFELSGEIEKVKISYLITLVETDGHFNQVLFWTLQSLMDEKRDMFINATNTLKEVQ